MRKFNIFFALAFLFTSCVVDDLQYIENRPIDVENGIKIFGTVQDFDVKKVTTRADEDSSELPSDSFISEMTMFIFKENGDMIQGYSSRTVTSYDDKNNAHVVTYNDDDKCSSAINLQKANPTFLIDTQDGLIASLDGDSPTVIFYDHKAEDLAKCKIYIVANAWHALEPELDKIKTLADLEAITLDIDDSLSMPMKEDGHYRGFPMIGTHRKFANNEGADTFDLSKTGENKAGAVAKIPLKKLYSKVSFTIQVNANEVVSTPRFKIEKAEVFNVPSKVRLGRELDSNGKPTYENSEDYIVEMLEMVGESSYIPEDYYHFTEQPKELPNTSFSRTEISHTTQKKLTEGSEFLIEFGFYMPEHKVTPNYNSSTFKGYPENIDKDFKQYYKPDLVEAVRNEDGTTTNGKNATFVRIHGKYTDHNGQIKNVRYDIYLGQNNTDDFTVKRNQLLTNKLVITGLTNYHDAYGNNQQNISVDHRVDVDYAGFNLSMERTAILDSHFEVRPLDIELSPGSSMTITIPEDYRSWVGMESDAARYAEAATYVSTGERKAVRKYFTNDLVTELNKATKEPLTVEGAIITAKGPEIRIEYNGTGSKIFRIWFYVDENPNVYDKLGRGNQTSDSDTYTVGSELYRNCPVEFKYIGTDLDSTDGTATINKTVTINFQQWNLWRVWSADKKRYYDIEHEEEYLNNYASDQQYGGTQDGMPYGLEGIQLSRKYPSIALGQSTGVAGWFNQEDAYTEAFMKLDDAPYYDFYLATDITKISELAKTEKLTVRNYSGLSFNEEIATTLKGNYAAQQTEHNEGKGYLAQIEKLNLTQSPSSAFAYCYHKNKRNDKGEVVEQKWFLPAIDEIEDITVGAYDEFNKVFQNKFYWSCQPSYDPIEVALSVTWTLIGSGTSFGTTSATYYLDNQQRARSTSVYFDGFDDNGKAVYKPSSSSDGGTIRKYTGIVKASILSGNKVTIDDGYKDLSSSVSFDNVPGNKARTEKCRIRAVYRSGKIE